jgi:Zn-dependent protease with chaperone function
VLCAFVFPAFLEYEPRATLEPLSFTLLSLTAIAAMALSASFVRCSSALWQSRLIMRRWLANTDRQDVAFDGIEVNHCQSGPPIIAVLGVWKTRIFVSAPVAQALSPEELEASLRHEAVHAHNHDILKKTLLQLVPAFLPGIDLLKPVTAHWSRMCELAADEQSVAGNSQRTLDLASALLKVVRLARRDGNLPTLSAALAQSDGSLLGYRIRRLLEMSQQPGPTSLSQSVSVRRSVIFGALLFAILFAAYPQMLSFTHELLEFLVQG